MSLTKRPRSRKAIADALVYRCEQTAPVPLVVQVYERATARGSDR